MPAHTLPAPQATQPVVVVDPAGQYAPAAHVHAPEHAADVSPVAEPYAPVEHSPEHAAVMSPVVPPYVPAGHNWGDAAPPLQYEPAVQEPLHDA